MSTTAAKTPAMQALEKAGRKLARLQQQRDAALEELKEAIRAADTEGGHTRQDLWRASGVARQTVYDAIRETEPATDPASV